MYYAHILTVLTAILDTDLFDVHIPLIGMEALVRPQLDWLGLTECVSLPCDGIPHQSLTSTR